MKWIWLFIIASVLLLGNNMAYSQEPGLATYQEIAQIIVDKTISQDVISSITLQSTSVQELQLPAELEQRIREDVRIEAIILTNEKQCVLGVTDEACIMINVARDPDDTTYPAIQETTMTASSMYIDELNEAFDTGAEFHSVFIHTIDDTNKLLDTSGAVSGGGTISAVYTMPMESTDTMFEKISTILVPKVIRESGGFYDVAQNLSLQDDAKMTFSFIPLENSSLLQLKTSVSHAKAATEIADIRPLEYLYADNLSRSGYFSAGFYPLNSLLHVVVLSPEPANISSIRGNILETQEIDGVIVPADISKTGWIFDSQSGGKIDGKWIFGRENTVAAGTVEFSLGDNGVTSEPVPVLHIDESVLVAVIIAIVAAAAAAFYLKGYRQSQK